MPTRSTVLVASVAGVLGGALIGGSALVGAQASPTPSPAADSTSARPCGAAWKKLPADLRTDLRAAKKLPAGPERRQALKEIRRDMLAGKYGEKAQRFAERRLGHRAEIRAQLPDSLKADLVALRGKTPEERKAGIAQIRKDALAGKYGEKVQQRAEKRQQHREQCRSEGGSEAKG